MILLKPWLRTGQAMAKDWRNLSLSPELLEALKLPPAQAGALKRIAATWPRPLSLYQRQEVQKVRAELARVKRDQASLQEYARILEDWLVERELGRSVSNSPAPAIGPDAPPAEQKSSPRPGSADAWIEELFSSNWHLLKPKRMHDRIVKEVEKRNKEAQKRDDKNAPQLQTPSLSAFRAALKSRWQKSSAQKTPKT
jgi:hypothetical protein